MRPRTLFQALLLALLLSWALLPLFTGTPAPQSAELGVAEVERTAIVRKMELPLWDAHRFCGSPMLGRDEAQLGDPLHWLFLVSMGGKVWAWHAKLIAGKLLFALGLFLLARRLGEEAPAGLCAGLGAAALGELLGWFASSGCFSLCHSPWVLLSWLLLREARSTQELARAGTLLALSSSIVLGSGPFAESLALTLGLQFSGLGLLLLHPAARPDLRARLIAAALAGLVCALIAAPLWLGAIALARRSGLDCALDFPFALSPAALLVSALAVVLIIIHNAETRRWCATRLLLLVAVLAWPLGWRATPPAPEPTVKQSQALVQALRKERGPYRCIAAAGTLPSGWPSQFGINAHSGPGPQPHAPLGEVLAALGVPEDSAPAAQRSPEALAALLPSLNFLNIRTLVTPKGTRLSAPGLEPVEEGPGEFSLYRGTHTWPRAFYTDRVFAGSTAADLALLLRTEASAPFAMVSPDVLSTLTRAPAPAGKRRTWGRYFHRENHSVTFEVESGGQGLVVLHEAGPASDFVVLVDGIETPVLTVNHAFLGVPVSTPGIHRFHVQYNPVWWRVSALLCLCGLGLGAALWAWFSGHRRLKRI